MLARPEINGAMREFDGRLGRVGAFRDEVIRRGIAENEWSGRDLSAEQSVSEVMNLMGRGVAPGQPTNTGMYPQNNSHINPPIIPNVQGKGVSPVRQRSTSIEDLKKLAAAMEGK